MTNRLGVATVVNIMRYHRQDGKYELFKVVMIIQKKNTIRIFFIVLANRCNKKRGPFIIVDYYVIKILQKFCNVREMVRT